MRCSPGRRRDLSEHAKLQYSAEHNYVGTKPGRQILRKRLCLAITTVIDGESGKKTKMETTIGELLNRKENRKTTKDHRFKGSSRNSRMLINGKGADGKLVEEVTRVHQIRTVKTTLADGAKTATMRKTLEAETALINLE